MQDFRKLRVAEAARRLAKAVYDATDDFPATERYGLTAQMRRAAISVGANIAEGCGRNTDRELAAFLQIALGPACEVEFEALLALDLGYLRDPSHERVEREVVAVKRGLGAFIARLRSLDKRSTINRVDETTKPATRRSR